MHWILQSNIYGEEGWTKLTETLDRLQILYSVHKCVPFIGTLDPEPNPPPGPVVVMGSYTLANEAKRRGWIPGAFITDDFDYEVQLGVWGFHMFNAPCWIGALKDVPEGDEPFFIRPVKDSKSFTGHVTDWPEFTAWRDRLLALRPEDGATVTGDTRVLVSAKREIAREYRTWIVDGKVATASLYKSGTRKHYSSEVDERVIKYAEARAAQFQPARAFVLDVFQTYKADEDHEDGDLYIGEINNLNAAGFYAADMQKLVMAIEGMVDVVCNECACELEPGETTRDWAFVDGKWMCDWCIDANDY